MFELALLSDETEAVDCDEECFLLEFEFDGDCGGNFTAAGFKIESRNRLSAR